MLAAFTLIGLTLGTLALPVVVPPVVRVLERWF
jgi:hypothetical protein